MNEFGLGKDSRKIASRSRAKGTHRCARSRRRLPSSPRPSPIKCADVLARRRGWPSGRTVEARNARSPVSGSIDVAWTSHEERLPEWDGAMVETSLVPYTRDAGGWEREKRITRLRMRATSLRTADERSRWSTDRVGARGGAERGKRRNVYTGLVGQSFLLRRSFAKAQTAFNKIILRDRQT